VLSSTNESALITFLGDRSGGKLGGGRKDVRLIKDEKIGISDSVVGVGGGESGLRASDLSLFVSKVASISGIVLTSLWSTSASSAPIMAA